MLVFTLSMRRRRIVVVALVTAACTGSGDGTGPPPQSSSEMSPLARGYLEQLVGVMQANSIKRLTIDWVSFRSRLFAAAPRAQTISDLDPAIDWACVSSATDTARIDRQQAESSSSRCAAAARPVRSDQRSPRRLVM